MRFEEIVLRGRGPILAAIAVVSLLAAVSYSRLEVANNIDAWFPPDDPDYLRYRDFRERFEGEDTLYVVIRAPDLFTHEALARIDTLTRTIARLPQVTRTLSLTNVEDVRGTAEGIEIAPLVPTPELDGPALRALRARVLADPFFPGRLVSPDGRTTAIVVELGRRTTEGNAAVLDGVEATIASVASPALEIRIAGWASANVLMNRLTRRDLRWGLPISVAVLSLVLALAFGSLRAIVTVILAVFLTILWTMGAFAALGFQGTMVTVSALPGILLALTLATAVHVVARLREEMGRMPDVQQAMHAALRGIALPVLLTCGTTAVGFASLLVAEMLPVRHLGLFAAAGMGIACLMCLTALPIALAAFPWRGRLAQHLWLERALARVAAFDMHHPRGIVATSLALALAGVMGGARLQPQGTNLHYLPADSPPVRGTHFIEQHFGGASEIEVVVSGPPDALKDPAVAHAVALVEGLLASYPQVNATFAYTDLLRRMNQALHADDPAFYRLPETKNGIAQELLLYEGSGGSELSTLVDVSSYDIARVTARVSAFLGLDEWARLYREIGAQLPTLAPVHGPPLRLEISGDGRLWLRQNLALLDTMTRSFGLAVVSISIIMMLLTRSVWLGLLAMIPNVLPVVLAVGTMGWVGVELDFATVMIACIALGVAVDDTIHYLVRYQRELAAAGDARVAMRRTLTGVGKAMVTTSVVLFLGMGSMVTSSFPPHQTFGVIMAMTMVFALVGDLFLLPALLILATPEEGSGRFDTPQLTNRIAPCSRTTTRRDIDP